MELGLFSYIGGHLGGARQIFQPAGPIPGPVSFGDKKIPQPSAGGQIGGNYQIGNVVLGAEADLSWATSRGDETCFGLTGGAFFASNCSVDPTLFSTVTAERHNPIVR